MRCVSAIGRSSNEVTKTLQQFTVGGLLGPRFYFMEDRRVHFILRGNF
jgi:hypothetical protein